MGCVQLSPLSSSKTLSNHSPLPALPAPSVLGNHQSAFGLWTGLFWTFHINGIHTIQGLLYLDSLTQHDVFEAPLECELVLHFYGRIIFHSMDISYIVYSFPDGHLGCFHLLANCEYCFCEHVSEYWLSSAFGIYLGVELLAFMVILCLNFLRSHQTILLSGCTVLHSH